MRIMNQRINSQKKIKKSFEVLNNRINVLRSNTRSPYFYEYEI